MKNKISAFVCIVLIGCTSPLQQAPERPDSNAASESRIADAPAVTSNSSVQESLPPPEGRPAPADSEYFPQEIGEIEYLGAIDDFRRLIVSPEKIARWKTNGVCVFYGYDSHTRIQVREGTQVVVTNGMTLWNVVDSVYVSRLPSVHPVRLFGRNKIIEARVRRSGGKVELPDGESSGCAGVEPGDIIIMLPRR